MVSFKSEKRAKSEWEKIKDYGNKINEKTRRKTENKDGTIFSFFLFLLFIGTSSSGMEKKPNHHPPNGTFQSLRFTCA